MIRAMLVVILLLAVILTVRLHHRVDYCLDENTCASGQRLDKCWPCNEPCVVTEDYCKTYGGFWSGEACKMDRANYEPKICAKAGGIWLEDKQKCDFSAKCPYRDILKSK